MVELARRHLISVCFISVPHYEFSGYCVFVKDFLNCVDKHKEKKFPSVISSWSVAVVSFTSIIRYQCTGIIQLFRLMFHIKNVFVKCNRISS